jgi:hypothetical protein
MKKFVNKNNRKPYYYIHLVRQYIEEYPTSTFPDMIEKAAQRGHLIGEKEIDRFIKAVRAWRIESMENELNKSYPHWDDFTKEGSPAFRWENGVYLDKYEWAAREMQSIRDHLVVG